jgi:hypothetical protein
MKNNNSFLAFSFSKGFTSPNLPIATFYQGDKELNFIIDTGSDDNIINKDALKEIKYEMVEHNGTLAGVGGVFEVNACNVSFQLEKETFTANSSSLILCRRLSIIYARLMLFLYMA